VVDVVSCGIHHGLALTCDGELWGWGVNNASQIHPTKSGIVSSAKASDKGTFFAPVLVRSNIPRGSHVMCGEYHSVLVTSQAVSTFCDVPVEHTRRVSELCIWGDNRAGVFGNDDLLVSQTVMTKFGGTLAKVVCGQGCLFVCVFFFSFFSFFFINSICATEFVSTARDYGMGKSASQNDRMHFQACFSLQVLVNGCA
jgi:hypothetical protein